MCDNRDIRADMRLAVLQSIAYEVLKKLLQLPAVLHKVVKCYHRNIAKCKSCKSDIIS
jgi:hypothetical protein